MAGSLRAVEPERRLRLELTGISKAYPSVVANDDIDLAVKPGEIHAVLGENGAGKSTLMKIIYGVVQPDAGTIRWDGDAVSITGPAQARRLGIGMVFQHFSLFETLTAAENIALGLGGNPDLHDLSRRIDDVSARYGLPVDPKRIVHSMSVGERQRVEIMRCLLQNPRLLIMDEPTSVLTPSAVESLFETLRRLASEGCSILYISHKLEELKALCHSATVLRGGRVVGTCDPSQETHASLARMMIGKDLPACQHDVVETGEVRLRIESLSLSSDDPFGTALKDLTLDVRAGEIVGIAGISGNGQQEMLTAISGEKLVPDAGAIEVCGRAVGALGPRARREAGLCFVPEERLGRGAVPLLSLQDNALLTAHREGMVRNGMIQHSAVRAFTKRCVDVFKVKCGGPDAEAKSLSGGNLQKFIVGREIMQKPKVLVVAQPTWGVDVGSAMFIRQELIDLRSRGTAILVISEELDELFQICDRIAVIAEGRLSPCKAVADTNVREIGLWMTGLWPGANRNAPAAQQEARHAHQA